MACVIALMSIGRLLCALLLVPVAAASSGEAKATGQKNHAALNKTAQIGRAHV